MIPETRRKELLMLLKQQSFCTVEHLAQSVYVSIPTMRRDLSQLEKEGVIRRVHGGAFILTGETPMQPFSLRSQSRMQEKQRIGQAAAALLSDHDTVFFDACSSCFCAARAIDANMCLSALTNSTVIAHTLAENQNIHVELTGGSFDAVSQSLSGPEAEGMVASRHARFAFVTVNSVDAEFGMSNISREDIPIKQAYARHADTVVLLVDSSRVQRKNFYKVFDFEDIHILITDQPLDAALEKVCADHSIRVIIAP